VFLSFSFVFCFLDGRFGTTLYIQNNGVVSIPTRHSSPRRMAKGQTTPKTQRHSSALWQSYVVGPWGSSVCVVLGGLLFGGVVVGRGRGGVFLGVGVVASGVVGSCVGAAALYVL